MTESPRFDHLVRLTDRYGTFEHAEHAEPRREHGYCVDDVARVLVVAAREPNPIASVRSLAQGSLAFVGDAMGPHGECRNRRAADGTVDERRLDRGLLGAEPLGTRHRGREHAVLDRRSGVGAVRARRRTALPVSAGHGLRRVRRCGRDQCAPDERSGTVAVGRLRRRPVGPGGRPDVAVARSAPVLRQRPLAGRDDRGGRRAGAPGVGGKGNRPARMAPGARRATATSR